MGDLGVKMLENEIHVEDDPYLVLGYGVNTYFEILGQLSTMFSFIFLLILPIFTLIPRAVSL